MNLRLRWWVFFVWIVGVMGAPALLFAMGILHGLAPQDADPWFWYAAAGWTAWTLIGCAIMDRLDRERPTFVATELMRLFRPDMRPHPVTGESWRPPPGPPYTLPTPRPPPKPNIRGALIPMRDAATAIERGCRAWHDGQLRDAIGSARAFLDEAEARIQPQTVAPPQQLATTPCEIRLQHPCG